MRKALLAVGAVLLLVACGSYERTQKIEKNPDGTCTLVISEKVPANWDSVNGYLTPCPSEVAP